MLWKVEDKFPKTLEITVGVGHIVIYLKWGTLSVACYHCGNLGHFTKHCPSLSESQEPLIPSYPGSKTIIPPEKVFGKSKLVSSDSPSNSDSSNASGPGTTGPFWHPIIPPRTFAEALNRNKGPATFNKPKTPNPPNKNQPKPQPRMEDRGKRQMDSEGFTIVQRR